MVFSTDESNVLQGTEHHRLPWGANLLRGGNGCNLFFPISDFCNSSRPTAIWCRLKLHKCLFFDSLSLFKYLLLAGLLFLTLWCPLPSGNKKCSYSTVSVPKKPCKCLWHYPASSWGRRDDGTVVNRRVADREKEAFQTTPQFQPGGKIALSRFLLLTLLKLLWHCPCGFIGADSDPDCRHQNLVLVSFQIKVNL